MSREVRRGRAGEVLAAMEAGDGPRVAAQLTADAQFWPPLSATSREGLARPVVGAAAIAELFTGARSFEYLHGRVLECLADGDHVVVHVEMNGRTRAGRDYLATHLWLFRFEGDRVAEAWEYADTAYVFERMGI